ncbi:MAG: M20/M25/M40 family metallo-hydrolase [Firmicutes bacterium]|nr:M20/M25/M40 family metallo-hydrolase [Bacillota bacterium]
MMRPLGQQELAGLIREVSDRGAVRELLVRLLRWPSPKTDLMEAEPQVLEFISRGITAELARVGVEEHRIDGMGNLIARKGKAANGRSFLYVTYAMNHPPERMPDPFSGEIVDGAAHGVEGECAWGRGACEQKGPLAAVLGALALIAAVEKKMSEEIPGDLLFVTSTAGETGRHDSFRWMIEKEGVRAEAAVLASSSKNEVCLGNKGRVGIRVKVKGRAAHISTPWAGVDAIRGAREIMSRLDGFVPEGEHPALGRVTLTVQGIKSFPFDSSTIPSECELVVDRRLLPGDEPEKAFRELEALVGTLDGYELIVQRGTFQYPGEVSQDSQAVAALAEGVTAMTGREPTFVYSHPVLDQGYLNRMGIETIKFGPGDVRFAHTDVDLVQVDEVVEAAQILAYAALRHLLGGE